MESTPSNNSLYEYLQKDVRRHVGVIENAQSPEAAAPEIKQLLEKLKTIDIEAITDSKTIYFLNLLLHFTSNSIARFASPEIRKEATDFQIRAQARGWEVFVNERKVRGTARPDSIPETFNADFGPYMSAIHMYISNPEEQIRRAVEICNKVLAEELPSDSAVIDAMAQVFKDKSHSAYDSLARSLPGLPSPKDLPGYDTYMALDWKAQLKVKAKQAEIGTSGKK